MPYSKLITDTCLVPYYNPRSNWGTTVKKITVHHMAGVGSGLACAKGHIQRGSVSANYYIGNDGDICLGVDEANRSWCSDSRENDYSAITIEVSNSRTGEPWPVSDKAYKSLVALCVDICRRYKIDLKWTGDKNGTLTVHRFFIPTGCPGEFLMQRMSALAKEVMDIVNGGNAPEKYELTNKEQVYNVKEKDTWKSIAKKFGMTDNGVALLEYNNYANANEKLAEKAVTQKTVKIPPTFVPGDVDGDGKVEAADARTALRASAKLETLDPDERMRADIDGDGKVTAADARKILRKSAGLEK